MNEKVIQMLSDRERAANELETLYCPVCFKPMSLHPPQQAFRCLHSLAAKEKRKFEESLIK
jgi:hypothetical protein